HGVRQVEWLCPSVGSHHDEIVKPSDWRMDDVQSPIREMLHGDRSKQTVDLRHTRLAAAAHRFSRGRPGPAGPGYQRTVLGCEAQPGRGYLVVVAHATSSRSMVSSSCITSVAIASPRRSV